MESKLYVGNLPYTTTDEDLRTLFAQVGAVTSATVIKDRETGRSKGFGFVEMETEAEAEQAISQFNGFAFNGRPLKVNPARPPEPRQGGGGYNNRSGNDRNRSSW
jgi:RNA recognition motif-containing protein